MTSESTASTQPRVLLVEDDPLLADLMSQRLTREHFEFDRVATGEAAIDALKKEPRPELILLDIILPGMNGFEVLKHIKADPQTKDIPVIILSNLFEGHDIEKGKRLGAERFVVKVSTPLSDVVSMVREVWKEKHS